MTEVIAVACVIESSLTLAAEWHQVQSEYIVPLLQRLGESHQNPAFRIACVSYGTADTMPTPILSKVFFSPPQTMIKDMREEPHKLGIGQTDSGCGYGMAALEGLVAAIELFDTLRSSVETAMTCHLIHFASTPPDPAERPMWNVSMALDSTTWDTLPSELKKRGIYYSNVLLRQVPRFTQLQAAAAVGPLQSAWFTVRAPHVIHLTGFPQKGTKRSGSADRSPEITKRAKTQSSPLKSPAVISAPISSPPQPAPLAAVKTPSIPPAVPPAPAPAATQSQPAQAVTPATVQNELVERFRLAHHNLKAAAQQAQLLEGQGRTEEAAKMRAEFAQKMQKFQQFKLAVAQKFGPALVTAAAEKAGLPTNAAAGRAASGEAQRPPTATDLAAKLDPNPATAPSTAPAVASSGAAAANAPGQPSGVQSTQNVAPEMAAQMQKLLDQQKNRPAHLGVLSASQNQNQPQQNQPQQQQQQPSQAQAQPPQQLSQPQQQQQVQPQPQPQVQPTASTSTAPFGSAGASSHPVQPWVGTLSWSGFDAETHVKKDVHAGVIIVGQHSDAMRPETWPSTMSLAPSQHHAVPPFALQSWLQAQHYVGLVVQTNPQVQDTKKNEEHFRSLMRLLTEKNVYALASWPGPNGVPENRIMLFVVKEKLAGAYFYMPGGVPELPKSDSVGPPMNAVPPAIASLLAKMSPSEQAAFAKLPQDRKVQWLKLMVQKSAAAARQQGQQQGQQGPQAGSSQGQLQAGPGQQQQLSQQALQPLVQQPPQPAGPSPQMLAANRNLQQQIQEIRPGAFNPWMQNSGPNVTAILNTAATGHPVVPNSSPQPNPAQHLMTNLGMNFGGMGGLQQLQQQQQQQQQAPQVAPGAMQPGQGTGMGMGAGMGMNMALGMNMGMQGMGIGAQGMHRRTPSAGSQTGMPAGLSYEMLQSFIQRNQEGSGGPNPGMGGM